MELVGVCWRCRDGRLLKLMEMRVMAINGKVFPNGDGGWLSGRNIATRFRNARGNLQAHLFIFLPEGSGPPD